MNLFDMESGKFYLAVFNTASVAVLGIWTYLRTKDKDNDQAVKSVAAHLAQFIESSQKANEEQNIRLTELAQQVSHMPTAQEVSRLSNGVATLQARVDGLGNLMVRVEHQTNLIHDHLLNKAPR
jgi:hypothetical protein